MSEGDLLCLVSCLCCHLCSELSVATKCCGLCREDTESRWRRHQKRVQRERVQRMQPQSGPKDLPAPWEPHPPLKKCAANDIASTDKLDSEASTRKTLEDKPSTDGALCDSAPPWSDSSRTPPGPPADVSSTC